MLKIRTATGNELVVTKNHPLFTTYYGLIFANETQNFSIGDYIATPRFIKVNPRLQLLPLDFERSSANNKKTLSLPKYLNSDLARLLGYIISEGYVQLGPDRGQVTFTNNDQFLLDDFAYLVKKLGLNYTVRSVHNSKSAKECYCSSIELARFLKLVEQSLLLPSKEKKVPQIICKSPNHVLREFIKALFDCEGHIMKNRRQIDISSSSRELIYDLKLLLLRFGILSQVSMKMKCATNSVGKIKRPYYELRISGKDTIKYILKIGFNHQDKNLKAQELLNFSKGFNTNLDLIPNLTQLLKDLRKDCGLRQEDINIPKPSYRHYEKGDRNISREQLRKIISSYKEENPLLLILNKIVNADIFWDKIVSIDEIPSESEFVYDLQVEETHNYIANCVVVHNSQLLQFISKAAPKARYVAGRSTTGAGITASVVKDEFLRGWALEAGAMVLANKGILCLDEMDKMEEEDTNALHEAMEQQQVTITKANIQATLRAETTVLAAANPKFGRFDPYKLVAEQIDLPPALINRFDLIFPMRDLPDKNLDSRIAQHVLDLHQAPETILADIPIGTLRKFISYVKQNIFPKMSQEAMEEIKNFYVNLRNTESASDKEGRMKPIPITPRQLEALIRLAEASARVRLDSKIKRSDARRAIELLKYCLMQVGIDPETGQIDIDVLSTGISTSTKNKMYLVRDLISALEEKKGDKKVAISEVVSAAETKGLDESTVMQIIDKLNREGEIFKPAEGFVKKI